MMRSNNQYGNTHFVKASVGKSNREKFGLTPEQAQSYCPIIGNFRPLESREAQHAQQAAPVAEPEPVVQYEGEDMPEDTFSGF